MSNTGKLVDAVVTTPGARVAYDGNCWIDGVPEPAAPVRLRFLDAAGSKTGRLLPTDNVVDLIDGAAGDLHRRGDAARHRQSLRPRQGRAPKHADDLDSDRAFMSRLDALRIKAGALMGFGDVRDLVIPKPVIVAPGQAGGDLSARYFMPHATHKAFAVTGAVGLATACATPGTIPNHLMGEKATHDRIAIEHPTGRIELALSVDETSGLPVASLLRTVRKIFEGNIYARVSSTLEAACHA